MTKLATLRGRLGALRRRRLTARMGTAYSALVTAILLILLGAFLIDWQFERQMTIFPRLVFLLAYIGVGVWAFRHYALPFFGTTESDTDMALMVERQQLDPDHRDLVAAMQFELPEAKQWGSEQLEGAVVDYVAEFGKELDVFEGFSREQAVRRGLVLAATALVAVATVFIFPHHIGAFFNRLAFGSLHYPTDTTIDEIWIVNDPDFDPYKPGNDTSKFRVLSLEENGTSPKDTDKPQSKPVIFKIKYKNKKPHNGKVTLWFEHGESRKLELKLVKPGYYVADDLQRMVEPFEYQIELGDAYTDPARVDMVPLPVIQPYHAVTPPEYVKFDFAEPAEQISSQQIPVLAGSKVTLAIACTNKKLNQATLKLFPENQEPVELTKKVEKNQKETAQDASEKVDRVVELFDDAAQVAENPAIAESTAKQLVEKLEEVKNKAREIQTDHPIVADALNQTRYPIEQVLSLLNEASGLSEKIKQSDSEKKKKEIQNAWKRTVKGIAERLGDQSAKLHELHEAKQFWQWDVSGTPLANVVGPIRYEIHVKDEDNLKREEPLSGDIVLKRDAKPKVVARAIVNVVLPTAKPKIYYELQDDYGVTSLKMLLTVTQSAGGEETKKTIPIFSSDPPLLRRKNQLPHVGAYLLPLSPLGLAKGDKVKIELEVVDYRGKGRPGMSMKSDPIELKVDDIHGLYAEINEGDKKAVRLIDAIDKRLLGKGDKP